MTKIKFPTLTTEQLSRVIADAVESCPCVEAVGLVGSFARGEQTFRSDVDLLIKGHGRFSDILESFGEYVRKILDYQFNKRLDIVKYEFVAERASRDPVQNEAWYYREGFAQMLNEVIWLYEKRPADDYENRRIHQASQPNL
ncbi:MAG: nucleotidyltransferase domain-containing protein [Defluviitaleaceae bacterium]|nr:nucleotidyltransferase domain-containing protein [Defluviitaleaceae bacterium]